MRDMILCLWLVLPFGALAQTFHPWEIGAGFGIAAYDGEINDIRFGKPLFGINPALEIHLRKNLRNHFAARFKLIYTSLSGDDEHYAEPAWRPTRGLSFSAPLFEIAALGEFFPLGLNKKREGKKSGLRKTPRAVSPFFAMGIGGTFVSPNLLWNDESANGYIDPVLAQVDKNHKSKPNFSIPMGLGIRFRASDHISIGLEIIASPTLNDYLDGISVAGDPAKNDWFLSALCSASYLFGGNSKRSKDSNRRSSNADHKSPFADADADGVADEQDSCPETPGQDSLLGCPDADHDGVADKNDLCPNEAGFAILGGCPDRDEDGIADKDDNCPEIKGVLIYRGCPAIDRDKDGLADAEDLCPDMSGQLQWKGCPDSDSDGLPDNKDACPGIAGPETLKGCPDTDADGISDKDDECPTMAGKAAKKGCPEAEPPAPGVPYKAVFFGSTLQDWYATSVATLDEVVAILQADPALFASLEGHTDNTGKEPANDLLAEKRAKKCLDYLVSKNIEAQRLNYLGFGSQRPAVPNDTREHRQFNRRVEIHFYKKM